MLEHENISARKCNYRVICCTLSCHIVLLALTSVVWCGNNDKTCTMGQFAVPY